MWYAVQVRSGSEDTVQKLCKQIISKEVLIDCFLPMAERKKKYHGEWKLVKQLLFPGYMFMISDCAEKLFEALKKVPEFTRLLGDESLFIPLYNQEVEFLQRFCADDYTVSMSVGLMIGEQIIVTQGVLKGYEGRIKKINRHKRIAVVDVDFFGRVTQVTVGLEIVEKREKI